MPFNSHTASLACKKSKREKSKITPNIQDRLDLLAAENLDYLLSHLEQLLEQAQNLQGTSYGDYLLERYSR